MAGTYNADASATKSVNAYYERKFLAESRKNLVLEPLAMAGRVPPHQGNKVVWNRWNVPTAKTTALSESADPTPTGLSSTIISANLAIYGNYEPIGELVDKTAVSSVVEKAVDLLAYEAALSIDQLCFNEISANGTAQLALTAAARNSILPADTMSVAILRKANRKLDLFGARKHTADRYVAVAHPDVIYDLEGDSAWTNAHIYTEKGINNVYNGEAGDLYGTRFVMSQNAPVLVDSGSISGSSDIYLTFVMGKDFFGKSDLVDLTTWVDSPSKTSIMRTRSDVAWKALFAVKTLNDSFGVRIETTSTFG